MKLGVFAVLYGNKTFDEACATLAEKGVQAIEIGAGGYPGKAHANPAELLADKAKLDALKATVDKYHLTISAISCHGNPVHPDAQMAADFHADFEGAVLLAEALGIDTVITFSGCPGDSTGSKYPNWVTCPWPPDFLAILDYQWNEVLIPYWKKAAEFAKNHGVTKIALEMHPGFCVYNPETLLKLRAAVGDCIGANFDPSHLFWQGIDPVSAIKEIGTAGALFHFHAKDTKIDPRNSGVNGVLDVKHYGDVLNRSWVFRSVGYGHSYVEWNDMVSMLKTVGYDGVLSIEHEDGLMSTNEGLTKAIEFLKKVLMFERAGDMWWA